MEIVDIALTRFQQKYSCAQAVFSALAERRAIDRELALRVAAGFGGGIARSAQTCGCVTGAVMAIGLEQPSVSPEENKGGYEKTYESAQKLMREFAGRNGSICCRDLLGCDIGTPEGLQEARRDGLFQTRCTKFVRDAVEIVDQIVAAKA